MISHPLRILEIEVIRTDGQADATELGINRLYVLGVAPVLELSGQPGTMLDTPRIGRQPRILREVGAHNPNPPDARLEEDLLELKRISQGNPPAVDLTEEEKKR